MDLVDMKHCAGEQGELDFEWTQSTLKGTGKKFDCRVYRPFKQKGPECCP